MPEELDRKLAHVVQADPRVSWARAGQVLGISATTAAHRWARLAEEGLVWVTTLPNLDHHLAALVEVDCHTEHLPAVIEALCAHPMIVSVDETTGDRDLLLTVVAPDLPTLSDLVIDWIGGLEGVHGSRSALITSVAVGSRSWRVNALAPDEEELLRPRGEPAVWALPADGLDVELARLLARDGRASAAGLARDLDVPVSTLHRRLQRLLGSGRIHQRCDVAPELAGWRLECTWTATIPLNHKRRVLQLLRRQPSLRSCLWITGATNLRVTFRVPHHAGIGAIESATARAIPGLTPAETIVHMRCHKSMGWLLDRDGRCTGRLVCPPLVAATVP